MEADHYIMSDSQYPHLPEPSQNDSGIFGTESDANHSSSNISQQKVQHFGGRPMIPSSSTERRYQFPELPPSLQPKLHTSVSVEQLGSDDILDNIPLSNRPNFGRRRYLPTHTLSQQEHESSRHAYGLGSPASLSQASHPPLRQQYLEGHLYHRKQTGSPASSDSSSCYNSANERLRSAPGSVISFPGSTFSSSTTSSLNSSRSGSKGILPRPSVPGHTSLNGHSRQPYHHPSIPEFVRKTQSEVPANFPQYYQSSRRYESESPEDDSTSMPNILPSMKKPNPVRPAPPPPSHRGGGENREVVAPPPPLLHENIYRQKKTAPSEEGRGNVNNRDSLKMKLDMLIHVIKMFSSKTGKENDKDAANLLLALSRTAETVEVMHQPACLHMLIQIIHNMEHKEDPEHQDIRTRANETLRNIVESKSNTRQGKHDLCVLNALEKIRKHLDMLYGFIISYPVGQRIGQSEYDNIQSACDEFIGPIRKLYKYSNDKEKYRPSIISLGGLQTAAEILIVNYRLLVVQKSNSRHGEKRLCHSSKIISVVISILINLTYGDVDNKSTLCAFREFLKALVYHVTLQNESIIASAAQVLRNLSWRATSDIKEALLRHDVAVALMDAINYCNEEATIQYITSALWNLSAHSVESRIRISSMQYGIQQLVDLLSYNSPSGTTSVVENVGGILKNLSVVIKDEKYRKKFREAGGLAKLAKHLKSKNRTVLANATGILWNLSAHHYEDQKMLWDLGCIPLLDIHRTSEHKSIRENARGALRNLLAFGQNNGWCSKSDVGGYNLKTQKGLSKSLCIAACYTFNHHLSQPHSSSDKHSSESLNGGSSSKTRQPSSQQMMPGRSRSSGNRGSTSSLSQPKFSLSLSSQENGGNGRHHNYQYPVTDDFDGSPKMKSNKDRLKFTRIASAPQASSSLNKEEMAMEDERFNYMPCGPTAIGSGGNSKHTSAALIDGSYPDDHGYPDEHGCYPEDHGYPEGPEQQHHGIHLPPAATTRSIKQQDGSGSSRSRLSPYNSYSYSQEMHGLSAVQLSNDHDHCDDTTTSLSVLESKLEKFDPNQPIHVQEPSYVELEADTEDEDDIDQPVGRGGDRSRGDQQQQQRQQSHDKHVHTSKIFSLSAKHSSSSAKALVQALEGTNGSGERVKSNASGERVKNKV